MARCWRVQMPSFGQPGRTARHPEDAGGLRPHRCGDPPQSRPVTAWNRDRPGCAGAVAEQQGEWIPARPQVAKPNLTAT
jgi:hypothetical protein